MPISPLNPDSESISECESLLPIFEGNFFWLPLESGRDRLQLWNVFIVNILWQTASLKLVLSTLVKQRSREEIGHA